MIIVTGGAGFIGSAVIWALNERGIDDILVVDSLDHDEKEHNLAPLQYRQIVDGATFREQLQQGLYDISGVEAVIHEGAITSTTEQNWTLLEDVNIAFSQEVIRWCVDREVRCVYVSSGAVYGDGSHGYSDDPGLFDVLEPLNLYGKSKLLVDIWARDAGYLDTVVGLRYFNVFGPNEWHKGDMRSVVVKKYEQLQRDGVVELFRSYRDDIRDGEQMRDFVYVKDAVAATLHFIDHPDRAGIYNIGTGVERTWNDVAHAMFAAAEKEPNIRYIPMPESLRQQYQYSTCADVARLRSAGFVAPFLSLEDAIRDYAQVYLEPHHHLGE